MDRIPEGRMDDRQLVDQGGGWSPIKILLLILLLVVVIAAGIWTYGRFFNRNTDEQGTSPAATQQAQNPAPAAPSEKDQRSPETPAQEDPITALTSAFAVPDLIGVTSTDVAGKMDDLQKRLPADQKAAQKADFLGRADSQKFSGTFFDIQVAYAAGAVDHVLVDNVRLPGTLEEMLPNDAVSVTPTAITAIAKDVKPGDVAEYFVVIKTEKETWVAKAHVNDSVKVAADGTISGWKAGTLEDVQYWLTSSQSEEPFPIAQGFTVLKDGDATPNQS